jgi:uncharacterized protein YgfB (UPF0149 family)
MADVKDSIKKLRRLRDTLCSQQDTRQEAFKAKDRVIEDLQEVYNFCVDKKTRKKQIEKKILDMLNYLRTIPQPQDGAKDD